MVPEPNLELTDLPHEYLGFASSTDIWIDTDAAGYGWWTSVASPVGTDSMSTAGVGLLLTLVHEMGHVIGHEHEEHADLVMSPSVRPGTRRVELPTAANVMATSTAGSETSVLVHSSAVQSTTGDSFKQHRQIAWNGHQRPIYSRSDVVPSGIVTVRGNCTIPGHTGLFT